MKKTTLTERLNTDLYNPLSVGYIQALLDIKELLNYLPEDMKFHKRPRTMKEFSKVLDIIIEYRHIFRERKPIVFIRCNSKGGYDIFNSETKEVLVHVDA